MSKKATRIVGIGIGLVAAFSCLWLSYFGINSSTHRDKLGEERFETVKKLSSDSDLKLQKLTAIAQQPPNGEWEIEGGLIDPANPPPGFDPLVDQFPPLADTAFFTYDRNAPPTVTTNGDQSHGTMNKVGVPLDLSQKFQVLMPIVATLKNYSNDRNQFLTANNYTPRCAVRFWLTYVWEIHERETDYLLEVVTSAGSDDCGSCVDGGCYEDWSIPKSSLSSINLVQRYEFSGFRAMTGNGVSVNTIGNPSGGSGNAPGNP
jgi:hypothetical protein